MSESERTYRHPHRRGETEKDAAPGAVCGRNAVRELVRSGRAIDKIFVLRGKREGSVLAIIAQARENKIPVLDADSVKLDSLSGGVNHRRACRREGIFGRVRYSCVCRRARRSAVYRYCGRNRGSAQSRRAYQMRGVRRSSRNNTSAQKKRGTYAHCVENIGGSA